MPIQAPSDTFTALGAGLLPKCESRSLFQSRFADPQATDKTTPTRKAWFNSLISPNRKAARIPSATWLPASAKQPLYARLMSRLMVDLAGGVMENANVLLDRYGLPYLPGSAVKGCARRMALQALHDWVAAATPRPATNDACAPCCEGFDTPAYMLAAIARIFGWVETDWTLEKNRDPKTRQETTWKSDFAWAASAHIENARDLLPGFSSFAGSIAFLHATPDADPGLELDVLTPHHTKYYTSTDPNAVALDTEDPVPVFFPAVRPQGEKNYFTFPLIPLRLAANGDLDIAKRWLAHGLELFGLGAKTAAGYGVFQPISDEARAAAQEEAAVAASDYSNDTIFKNAVLSKLNPGALNQLEQEIKKLTQPENEPWRTKLVETLKTKDMKDIRKRLQAKDWFPKDWLPD